MQIITNYSERRVVRILKLSNPDCETVNATGVELGMDVQPTQNVWWKYRQKRTPPRSASRLETLRIVQKISGTAG